MSDVEVKLPSLGEGAPDAANVSFFFVREGDDVREGADFCEMFTDKATFTVPCPLNGRVKRILVQENQSVKVGQPLAVVETA
jgi:pyruvate/2-oxoglutarate dehydrogenase complex dihydrolipoamide acyltransferase (E2) component